MIILIVITIILFADGMYHIMELGNAVGGEIYAYMAMVCIAVIIWTAYIARSEIIRKLEQRVVRKVILSVAEMKDVKQERTEALLRDSEKVLLEGREYFVDVISGIVYEYDLEQKHLEEYMDVRNSLSSEVPLEYAAVRVKDHQFYCTLPSGEVIRIDLRNKECVMEDFKSNR